MLHALQLLMLELFLEWQPLLVGICGVTKGINALVRKGEERKGGVAGGCLSSCWDQP